HCERPRFPESPVQNHGIPRFAALNPTGRRRRPDLHSSIHKPRIEGEVCQVFWEMTEVPSDDVTAMLRSARAGDEDAAAKLLPQVYDELRKLARSRMAKLPPGQTLQPTALVHEAYVRLLGKDGGPLENRRHFFFVAARAMRDILVEHARRKA